jgi:molybdopterin converting factor small subunit
MPSASLPGHTVAEVLAAAEAQFGAEFSRVLATANIWLNGDEVGREAPVGEHDELAVLPPVSGG